MPSDLPGVGRTPDHHVYLGDYRFTPDRAKQYGMWLIEYAAFARMAEQNELRQRIHPEESDAVE
jgi:hypothetical protein